jgi:hypothetical protein
VLRAGVYIQNESESGCLDSFIQSENENESEKEFLILFVQFDKPCSLFQEKFLGLAFYSNFPKTKSR